MYKWLVIIAIAATALAASHWKANHSGIEKGRAEIQANWDAAKIIAKQEQDEREAALQAAANKAAKELEDSRQTFEAGMMERQNELRKTTANLRACRVSADTVRLLNESTEAARSAAGYPSDTGSRGKPVRFPNDVTN